MGQDLREAIWEETEAAVVEWVVLTQVLGQEENVYAPGVELLFLIRQVSLVIK